MSKDKRSSKPNSRGKAPKKTAEGLKRPVPRMESDQKLIGRSIVGGGVVR